MGNRAIAYVRKSNEPGESNKSLQDQREWVQRTARARDLELDSEDIFEEVVSGWSDFKKRPARDQLIIELQQGNVQVLLVRDLDRLARRMVDLSRLVDLCRQQRVMICTADRNYKPGDAETALLVSVLGGLAESEATRTSERLKRTAENIRFRGGWNGPTPFGWVTAHERNERGVRTLVLHPDESKVVREIVDLRLSGSSVPEIVRHLKESGRVNRAGRPWQYRSVASLLRHPVLAGYNSMSKAANRDNASSSDYRDAREVVRDPDGKPVKSHEAVVTVEEWETLQVLMQHRPLAGTRASARKMLLSDLIFCMECSSRMTSSRNQNGGTYLCHGRLRGLDCPGSTIASRSTERWVLDIVAKAIDDPEVQQQQHELLQEVISSRDNGELATLHEQYSTTQQDIDVIRQEVKTAPASVIGTLMDRLRDDEQRLERLAARIEEVAGGPTARTIPPLSGAEFLAASFRQQRNVIHTVVRKIGIRSAGHDPGAVKGLFGSQGVNLQRISIWFWGDPEDSPRRGDGFALTPSESEFKCPRCIDPPRFFRYRRNLDHHVQYAHPQPVECPECGDTHPLPGLPSHRRNKHGVTGKRTSAQKLRTPDEEAPEA